MKNETEKLENLKKHFNICKVCGKVFLGVYIEGGKIMGKKDGVYTNLGSYPLTCGKCPRCAINCCEDKEKRNPELIHKIEGRCKGFKSGGVVFSCMPCYISLESRKASLIFKAGVYDHHRCGMLIDLLEIF